MTSKFGTSALATVMTVGLIAAGIVGVAKPAAAQAVTNQVVYSNLTTFSGNVFTQGGATLTAGGTDTALDDIQLSSAATGAITGLQFSVANINSEDVTANVEITFYSGTASGPGTLLGGLLFNPLTFTGDEVAEFTYNQGTTIFTAPSNGFFWVGETFEDTSGGGATATIAELDNLGEGIFNPPTVGSSQDGYFVTSNPGEATDDDPAGSLAATSANPAANFGFSFNGGASSATPEPTSIALALSAAGVAVGGMIRRQRARG